MDYSTMEKTELIEDLNKLRRELDRLREAEVERSRMERDSREREKSTGS